MDYQVVWAAACDLVENLLLGVQMHLPEVTVQVTVSKKNTCVEPMLAKESNCEDTDDLVAIEVGFSRWPIFGEVATPSRFCHEVHLLERVRFAMQLPANSDGEVVLKVSGLEFPTLSEIPGLRSKIKEELGSSFNAECASEWWMQHKDTALPLRSSKLHRIYESFWGLPGATMVPHQCLVDFIWPLLIGTNVTPEAFLFYLRGDVVRMTCRQAPGRTPEEVALQEQLVPFVRDLLWRNRVMAEKFAASSFNFGMMFHGPAIGLPAAKTSVITRLLSAAKWWGPGSTGWQQWDQTWQCRDRKNSLGMIVERQGRIMWRLDNAQTLQPCAVAKQVATASTITAARRERGLAYAGCCRRRKAGLDTPVCKRPILGT